MKENPNPSGAGNDGPRKPILSNPELRNPHIYRMAFLNVMNSRGLEEAIGAIEETNCNLVLEAQPDDEDGAIELTGELKAALFSPFAGLRAPEGDNEPVLVNNVILGLHMGVIEITPKLVDYVDVPKTEGYITVSGEGDVARAIASEIYFDFDEGEYDVDIIRLDASGPIIEEEAAEPKTKPKSITNGMMNDLASLLTAVNKRRLSRAAVYKNEQPSEDSS